MRLEMVAPYIPAAVMGIFCTILLIGIAFDRPLDNNQDPLVRVSGWKDLYRLVDVEAGVVIYHLNREYGGGIAVLPLSQTKLKEASK